MKKILLSLSTISAVAILAVVGTTAFFSDEEKSTGNTFTAGTIDIAVDGQNPWTGHYNMPDLKPGETGNLTFNIQNVGTNPVDVSKTLKNFVESTGTVSEPECDKAGGAWDNNSKACDWDAYTAGLTATADVNDIQTQIVYDLSVKVYASDAAPDPIWWQALYLVDQDGHGKSLTDVYGTSGGNYVRLGMIPVGGHMIVTQSYHFNHDADNKYQGDKLTFDMEIKGDQLTQNNGYASVALENKGGAPEWQILGGDSISGNFQYQTAGAKLNYNLTGTVKTAGTYTLIYVGPSGDYPAAGSKFLGQVASSGTSVILSGSVDTGSITSGKIWLVPASTYNSGSAADGTFNGWDHANNLYETALINYVKN